jgi:hypothetical protein
VAVDAATTDGGAVDAETDAAVVVIDTTPVPLAAPVWLKLVRTGAKFSGYTSTDGTTWELWSEIPVLVLPDNIYVGVAATAQTATGVARSVLEAVQMNTPPLP